MFEDIIGASLDLFGTEFGADPDLDALMGARPSYSLVGQTAANPAAASNRQEFARQLALRNSGTAMVVERGPTKGRKYPLGFGPTVIAAGATANIITQPQTLFKGYRLVIPSDFAGAVSLNDIKVGNKSQLTTSNPVPGRVFTEFGVGVDLNLDTAAVSQQISLNVTNNSGAAVTFSAALIGISVE